MNRATSQLAARLVATDASSIRAERVNRAQQRRAGGQRVTTASTREPLGVGHNTLDDTRDLGGTPAASVVAGGFRTSALNAAYAKGTLWHALDFDTTSVPVNHPTLAALPAILAVAEREKLNGRDVV